MPKRNTSRAGAPNNGRPVRRPVTKKAISASPTSAWIIREVAFATHEKQQKSEAAKLRASLEVLERGVEEWNRWRSANPKARPHLSNANLSWTNSHIGSLEGIDFSNTELQDASFEGGCLSSANLTGANLEHANLTDASLQKANLTEANLRWADLTSAHLGFGRFDHADMTGANLTDAELWCASLQGTNLTMGTLDRIEASGAHVMGADLSFVRLLDADLSEADLSSANLTYATLVGTNLQNARLTGCNVYGISVWDVSLEGAEQSDLTIGRGDESPVRVDDIEVAQFVHLLLDHRKLRKAISAVAERAVLILGRFSDGGLEVLEALAARLREMKYLPIIFDFDRPSGRNYTETIMALAGISRFVVADLSGASVPQELHATVPHFKIPFVPILRSGTKPYSMLVDILEYPWVVRPPVEFKDKEQLKEIVKLQIVSPAEIKHRSRQRLLKKLFNPAR